MALIYVLKDNIVSDKSIRVRQDTIDSFELDRLESEHQLTVGEVLIILRMDLLKYDRRYMSKYEQKALHQLENKIIPYLESINDKKSRFCVNDEYR